MDEISYSKVKDIITDTTKSYFNKVETLLLGWKNIYETLSKTPNEPYDDFIAYLHKSSLHYFLLSDWAQLEGSLKAKFSIVLHKVITVLSKTDQEAFRKCKLLIKLIHEPWKNTTLHKILHSLPPTDKEVEEYISVEGNELLLMRLEVLCEEKCEDLALKLASALSKYLDHNTNFKKVELDYVNDIYLLLLFQFKRNQEIIDKLKNLNLMEGLDLVKRFASRKTCDTGVWKLCDKVTEIAAHTVLTSAMVQNVESKDKSSLLYDLVNEWALIHVPKLNKCLSPLCNMVRKVVQKAESPIHIYIFAQVLHKQLGDQVKPLCIELYIRGFTSNINLIEHYKSCNDKEETLKAEILLSNSFLELSEILHDNVIIHRECILTAFSLYPTKECLKRLENAAFLCCKNEDITNSDIWDNFDPFDCVHDRQKNGEQFIEAVNSLNILNSDLLGLAPHLCDDLSTVLCSPRCQTLSWSLGWSHLKKQCEKYFAEHFCRKARCTELKYLNMDQFKTQAYHTLNQSNKKSKKKKINKTYDRSSNIYNKKEMLWHKRLSHGQKGEVEKNIFNYSFMNINDILIKSFQENKSSSNDKCNKKESGLSNNICLSGSENIAKYANRSYSTKFRKKEKKGKNVFYNQSSLGYILRCGSNFYENTSSEMSKSSESLPVNLPDSECQTKLFPLLRSINSGYPQILLADILSKNCSYKPTTDSNEKTDINENAKSNKIFHHILKNDKLFAKYIPGMSSLDLIVPLRPEPTVQVVHIPSSNTVLQPASSNAPSTIQTNSTTISIAKPLSEPVSTSSTEIVTTHTQTQNSHIVENNDGGNNSNLLLTTVVNQGVSRIHGPDHNCSPLSSPNSGSTNNRTQNKSSISSNNSEIVNTSDPINSILNISSHEGSTQVTAHIQRVGQPHKQKLLFDETNVIKSAPSQNSNVHVPGTLQVYDEPLTKHSQTGQIYRFILKDGKILEQYCQSNQNPTFSLPEVINESNTQGNAQSDHIIKLFKKKKDQKKDETSNSENIQVPSLPQFHQAFRRQVYQSGSIVEGTSLNSSPRHFPEEAGDNQKPESVSTPISKAVQTVLKDAETSTKCSEKLTEDPLPVSSNPSSLSDIKDDRQKTDLQSSSSVIFTCKVPITVSSNTVLQTKPVTILKASNSQEMIGRNNHKTDCEQKHKDSVIRSNMNALLAAALQNSPAKSNSTESSITNSSNNSLKQVKGSAQDPKLDSPPIGTTKLRMPSPNQKNIRRHSSVTQSGNMSKFPRPPIHSSSMNSAPQAVPPVVTIPLPSRTVQVLTTNINQNSLTNLSKVDCRRDQLSQNSEQTSVSSTTLEQLREFESVLEQVTNTSQMKERGNAKKSDALVPTSASNSDFPNSNSPSKVNTLFQTSLVGTISDLNNDNRVSLAFISKAATTCTNTMISGSPPKITANTPVVVVQSCSSRPLASPALSINSQNSPGSSPSTPPTSSQSKLGAKLSKPKAKSIGKTTTPTTTLKVSTLPKPQQKPQEDEQTTQRIYAILDKYAEQLRNSPELKNKPAPRRRSNPPTNPSQSSKRKKSSHSKSKGFSNVPSCSGLEMSPSSEDVRTAGSEDSSNGVSQITQTMNSPHSRSEEHSNPGYDASSDVSEPVDKDQRLQHRILLSDQSSGSGRTVIVQDNVSPVISVEGTKVIAGKQLVVGSSATVPLTLQLPSTANVKQVLFPVPTDGRPFVVAKVPKMYRFHQVTMPSGSPLIASASSGTVLLRQMCLNKSNSAIKQVKLPVVSQISTHVASQPTVVLPSGSQQFTLSTGSSIDGDSLGIALDNTILLNSSSTSSSSIGFIQRNLSKSNMSSSSLNQSRHMVTQETNTSSPENEILPTSKCESTTTIKSENGDMSKASDNCELDYKTDEIKFSLDSSLSSEKSHKGISIISSPSTNNNWVQVLKESNGVNNIISKSQDTEEKNTRNDSMDTKGCDGFGKNLDKKSNAEIKNSVNDQICDKQKNIDDNSYCVNTLSDSKSILNTQQINDHWQFNIKLEKVGNSIKNESLSPTLREAADKGDSITTLHQNSLTQSQGLKRKVENTIFQIAFKRDKMKLIKDDFVQQRTASVIERELKLQKSLSEECEDLGVDKPSTSDLFPEAELLLDPDPLSRDSLQGELFHKADSSSSSSSSPNHSPIFTSKCTNNWKKHKRNVLRHKYNYTRSCSSSKKIIPGKKRFSKECTSNFSKNIQHDANLLDNSFKCISKDGNCINECALHETDMECNDSDPCNFTDCDDHNDTDILDTEGDSDNDFLHKTRDCRHNCSSQSIKEPDNDKSSGSSLLRRLTGATFNKCDYYSNKDSSDKRSIGNSPWFQMIKGIHKESLDPEIDKNNRYSSEGNDVSSNGILDEFEDHQDTMNNFVSNQLLHVRKRKKVGLFLASESDDSGGSMDMILTGSDSCSDYHDNHNTRSSRGKVKKGCPCLNGPTELSKKKKDLPILDKTDKPSSTKTSFALNNKKAMAKTTVKLVNRKR